MPGSAALRESLRARDGWTVSLFLATPLDGAENRGKRRDRKARHDVGPQRGVITLDADPDSDSFVFHRWARPPVRLRYDQVALVIELAPPPLPPPPPLPVEQVPREPA